MKMKNGECNVMVSHSRHTHLVKMKEICRTCFKEMCNPSVVPVQVCEIVKFQLLFCIPELKMDLFLEPKLCVTCLDALNFFYGFKNFCLINEQQIYHQMQCLGINSNSKTLAEVLCGSELIFGKAGDVDYNKKDDLNTSTVINPISKCSDKASIELRLHDDKLDQLSQLLEAEITVVNNDVGVLEKFKNCTNEFVAEAIDKIKTGTILENTIDRAYFDATIQYPRSAQNQQNDSTSKLKNSASTHAEFNLAVVDVDVFQEPVPTEMGSLSNKGTTQTCWNPPVISANCINLIDVMGEMVDNDISKYKNEEFNKINMGLVISTLEINNVTNEHSKSNSVRLEQMCDNPNQVDINFVHNIESDQVLGTDIERKLDDYFDEPENSEVHEIDVDGISDTHGIDDSTNQRHREDSELHDSSSNSWNNFDDVSRMDPGPTQESHCKFVPKQIILNFLHKKVEVVDLTRTVPCKNAALDSNKDDQVFITNIEAGLDQNFDESKTSKIHEANVKSVPLITELTNKQHQEVPVRLEAQHDSLKSICGDLGKMHNMCAGPPKRIKLNILHKEVDVVDLTDLLPGKDGTSNSHKTDLSTVVERELDQGFKEPKNSQVHVADVESILDVTNNIHQVDPVRLEEPHNSPKRICMHNMDAEPISEDSQRERSDFHRKRIKLNFLHEDIEVVDLIDVAPDKGGMLDSNETDRILSTVVERGLHPDFEESINGQIHEASIIDVTNKQYQGDPLKLEELRDSSSSTCNDVGITNNIVGPILDNSQCKRDNFVPKQIKVNFLQKKVTGVSHKGKSLHDNEISGVTSTSINRDFVELEGDNINKTIVKSVVDKSNILDASNRYQQNVKSLQNVHLGVALKNPSFGKHNLVSQQVKFNILRKPIKVVDLSEPAPHQNRPLYENDEVKAFDKIMASETHPLVNKYKTWATISESVTKKTIFNRTTFVDSIKKPEVSNLSDFDMPENFNSSDFDIPKTSNISDFDIPKNDQTYTTNVQLFKM